MSNSPEPVQTPDGPAYEGRVLARADEDVVDQGVGFDIRTLMTRRRILGLVGLGIGAATLAACAPVAGGSTAPAVTASPVPTPTTPAQDPALPSGEIPDETAGPYPGDGSNGPDVLDQSGIVRDDIRPSIGSSTPVDGVPLTFTLRVTDMANGDALFAGAAVYAWHCDAQGRYSMYTTGVEGETWLRGVQVADANGQVTFTSIVPGCYPGRWTHIHFEVYPDIGSVADAANAIATSQLAFPQNMLEEVYQLPAYDGSAGNLAQLSLATDNVFGEDGGSLQMATISGNATNGYSASLVARVDTRTQPAGGSTPGGGRP